MHAFPPPPPSRLEEECLVLDLFGDPISRTGASMRGGGGGDLEVLDGFTEKEDGPDNIVLWSRQPSGFSSTR